MHDAEWFGVYCESAFQLPVVLPDGTPAVYSPFLVLELLTGELPFAGTTAQDTMVQRLTDEPATLAEVRPDLRFPTGLQAALDTALARSPGDR